MKSKAILSGFLFLMLLCVAQVSAEGKISAYMFGDYAYIAKSSDADLDGKSGFVVRRIYFTYDNDIAEKFSARLRTEMSQKDFSNSSAVKMEPVVKDAYLKWKFDRHALYIGLSGTPTWGAVEKFWGYRWLEKTPLDLHKYGSSRDLGFAFKGALDKDKKINYHIMVGHGASNSGETDKGKKIYGSLLFKPSKKAIVEIYGDFEDSEGDESNTASYVFQGFAGFNGDFGRVGVQFAHHSEETSADTNITQNIISGFAVIKINEKANAVGRIDFLTDPNPGAAKIAYIPMANSTENLIFVVAGIDFLAAKNVHFQPNVELVMYGDDISGGEKPDTEIIPRVSVYFKF
jgi:Phosphate-selective porin O and P